MPPEAEILILINMETIIKNHKKAATHLEEAAKLHLDAAKLHEAGSHDKAHECCIKANGHTTHACEAQKEILKQHATAK